MLYQMPISFFSNLEQITREETKDGSKDAFYAQITAAL